MADVALEDLLSRVRAECGGCPTDVMTLALRDVIRDFCKRTRAWQYEVESESILALVSDYDIELPTTQAYPVAIEYLTIDGTPSTFKSTDWLDRNITNWRYREADDFTVFTQIQPKIITFPCIPQHNGTVGGMYYKVSLQPTENASAVPQELADEWIEVWADGAKGQLKAMSNKPWTDVKRADMLEERYRVARGRAQIRVNRSYGNHTGGWVGPKFA